MRIRPRKRMFLALLLVLDLIVHGDQPLNLLAEKPLAHGKALDQIDYF